MEAYNPKTIIKIELTDFVKVRELCWMNGRKRTFFKSEIKEGFYMAFGNGLIDIDSYGMVNKLNVAYYKPKITITFINDSSVELNFDDLESANKEFDRLNKEYGLILL